MHVAAVHGSQPAFLRLTVATLCAVTATSAHISFSYPPPLPWCILALVGPLAMLYHTDWSLQVDKCASLHVGTRLYMYIPNGQWICVWMGTLTAIKTVKWMSKGN